MSNANGSSNPFSETGQRRQQLLRMLKYGPKLSREELAKWAVEQAKRAA